MIPLPSSFGDIIAAANLALSIYKALSASAGATYEYQCLVDELYSFHLALKSVDQVLANSAISPSDVHAINEEAASCRNLLEKFWDRIKSYQKSLGGGGRDWKDSWRKIGWGLFKTNEVADFRQKISQRKQTIAIFLSGLGISLTSNYGEDIRKTLVVLTTTTKEILHVQKQLPPQVGYSLDNAVILQDVFGKPITVTWELCFSPDALHTFLTGYFVKKIGCDYVKRREYSISSADGKSIVKQARSRHSSIMEFDPVAWRSVVKKGAVLTMSIEVRRVKLTSTDQSAIQKKTCPRCYRTEIGVMPDGEWLECTVEVEKAPVPDPSIVDFRNIRMMPVAEVKGKCVCELVDPSLPATLTVPSFFLISSLYVSWLIEHSLSL
ncbi:hypothetical protein GALMADRAFT_55764 [Galerina marginata CBS 339.88]|uniref:Ubiquitin-like domain-containing protein n=1 Tax=Galerina marginata (strain CBS 339.88) TaxID=685588 RepID=A0A067TN87_GALM3|nr:hypothetical protein GALMADRAFT_55764 [Galerina marginata CBS 339.88]